MIKVLVADDHPVVRQGIRQMFASTSDVVVASEATAGRDLLEQVRTVAADLIPLDLSLPDVDGLDLLKQVRRDRPRTPVIVLTMHSDDQTAIRALKARGRVSDQRERA
jgi:two-component system, NarL family, invasion response regulator UvrY